MPSFSARSAASSSVSCSKAALNFSASSCHCNAVLMSYLPPYRGCARYGYIYRAFVQRLTLALIQPEPAPLATQHEARRVRLAGIRLLPQHQVLVSFLRETRTVY